MNQSFEKIKILIGCIFVAILVVLTYYIFESAVHHSITYIWNTVFDTQNKRILLLPLALAGALLFFGSQHFLDPKSENHESHSLGGTPIKPTATNYIVILIIGYFSLVGGASLGPEAVLVPACGLVGTYIALKLFKNNQTATGALTAAATMALFTAFFHSYIVGILTVFLVAKIGKTRVNLQLLIIAVISSVSAYLFLNILSPKHSYFNFPHFSWKIAVIDLLVGVLLAVAGYLSTFALKYTHLFFISMRTRARISKWWILAIIAGLGLGLIYIIGGPLVEFTGNESIAPLISQASSLGTWSVVGILLVKLIAIGWSKAVGYRGGLIFPMIFVASSLVALSQLFVSDVNFGVGLIAAMVGVIVAESKAHVLL